VAFVKDEPAKAASLVARIQKLTEQHKEQKLQSFVVFLSGGTDLKDPIEKLAAEKKISIPMTFLPGGTGDAGFGAWKVNPEAKNTILLYNKRVVQNNFVNVDEKGFDEVAKAAATMLGK
jgi:hypothetical protein